MIQWRFPCKLVLFLAAVGHAAHGQYGQVSARGRTVEWIWFGYPRGWPTEGNSSEINEGLLLLHQWPDDLSEDGNPLPFLYGNDSTSQINQQKIPCHEAHSDLLPVSLNIVCALYPVSYFWCWNDWKVYAADKKTWKLIDSADSLSYNIFRIAKVVVTVHSGRGREDLGLKYV